MKSKYFRLLTEDKQKGEDLSNMPKVKNPLIMVNSRQNILTVDRIQQYSCLSYENTGKAIKGKTN
jgi:hypothetical protein